MNLQRREEIRVIAECPNDRHWAQEMRRAVAELLAHIDTLEQTAAERVIADGSRGPTPDYTGEGSAWVPPVESHSIGTADSVYFRRELESLAQRLPSADGPWLARYLLKLARVADSATVDCAPVEAPAVVVPLGDTFTLDLDEFGKSLACITINSKNRGVGYQLCGTMGDGHFSRRTFDITPYLGHCLNLIGIRAIPAGRVLGEGMVAVDRVYLSDLEETVIDATESLDRGFVVCQNCGEQEDTKTLDVMSMGLMPMKTRIDALRANQGGADARKAN